MRKSIIQNILPLPAYVFLSLSSGNAFSAAISMSSNFNGFVNSITDPTGALGTAIVEGDIVTADFLISAGFDECNNDAFLDGEICYFGGSASSTLNASLSVGDVTFDNTEFNLKQIRSGRFNGDSSDALILDGAASGELGVVNLDLNVEESPWFFWSPGNGDYSAQLNETPYISCDLVGCLYETFDVGSFTELVISNGQYDIEIYLTDFYVSVSDDPISTSAVPVPGAIWLFGSGFVALLGVFKRRH